MKLEAFREVVLESSSVEELKEKVRQPPLLCTYVYSKNSKALYSSLDTICKASFIINFKSCHFAWVNWRQDVLVVRELKG